MTCDDLYDIALIHKEQFKSHFLGKFSVGLIRGYYESFTDNTIFLKCKDPNGCCGFILGGAERSISKGRKKFVSNYKYKIILESIFKPRIYFDVIKRIFSFISFKPIISNHIEKDNFVILSIAVSKINIGSGVAKKLCEEFEDRMLGQKKYGLYVMKENLRAINFYKKIGFDIKKDIGEEYYMEKVLK